ncbi:MAG TPA: FtsQ-type POTRA domain-containing protein [Candidatus Limnocylindria bacterium]|nr:FtsQ-type POTRA domain-containing protein [Candidatus Limnocylindria bacterium]
MGYYQGRALERRPLRRAGRLRRWLHVAIALVVLATLAHLPWSQLRRRFAVVSEVRVEGMHYLDAAHVQAISGIQRGDDLFRLDLPRARQELLLDSRVAEAEVGRRLPRGVRIRIVERVPVLLVDHGVPWELDSAGVLLAPLAPGVVADVPRLIGPRLVGEPAGTQLGGPEVDRGLSWARALEDPELQLAGQVSELDVRDPQTTAITLLSGTRVLGPAAPPSRRRLSALRVVLADLQHKGTVANEVDLRYENQVIVRPVSTAEASHSG